MKKWNVGLDCSIYRVLFGVNNAYLIDCDSDIYLIDTGIKKVFSGLKRNIEKAIGKRPISYLILTHTHFDHCGNAAQIKEYWGTKVIVSDKEAEYLKGGSTPLPKGTSTFTDGLSNFGRNFLSNWFLYQSVIPDVIIDESYSLNENLKIIATPGHSKGSLTIVIKDQFAIVGDNLIGAPRGSVFPQFADEKELIINTWVKLLNSTKCHTFLPGHGIEISRHRLEKEVAIKK